MVANDAEQELLRSVALENARTILEKRQRAERQLLAIKDALEQRTAQLAGSVAMMQATLESTFDGIVVTDGNRRITGFNEKYTKMWRIPREVMATGEHARALAVCARQFTDPEAYLARIEEIYASSPPESLDLLTLADGRVYERFSKIQVIDGANAGRVWSIRDVTAQKHGEAELRQAEIALRDTDRRKDEFIATLAHELRNPLAPIRQAALISKAPAATEAQKRWSHDVIDRQVHFMSLLLDDLLDISRVTRGTLVLRMQPTELAAAVDVAIETARPLIDAKRHVLSVNLPHEPVQFTADPLRLAQILSNLLTNAAKYTDPEGQIRISASCDADQLTIRIADSGVGIGAENLPRIFDMFSQLHPTMDHSEGGLGIGLALAKGLVKLHGGTIEADSAGLGHGSEFTVRLPVRISACARAASSAAAPPATVTRRRVLIADDNRDSAETLAMLLRVDGHEVAIAHDGSAALATFGGFAPDVVLLDIGMPGANGYEVAQRIRHSGPGAHIKLIAITGWGQESDKERAFAAGFDHHLTKPVDRRQLNALLEL
jgi:signal transduction histidine kinase